MTGHAHPSGTPQPFDPDVWQTWPIPPEGIIGRHLNGDPRLDSYAEGWRDGFEVALRMGYEADAP